MMRVLMIGDKEKEAAKKVVDYALDHSLSFEEVKGILAGDDTLVPGYNSSFHCVIPIGFETVFSFEQQRPGWTRHLSVSVDAPGKLPNTHSVESLMALFGFENTKLDKADSVWTEEIGDGDKAINVVEIIKEVPPELEV